MKEPNVFFRYTQKQKAYKLYCLNAKTVYISRDVKFFENLFPFHYLKLGNDPIKSFFLPLDNNERKENFPLRLTNTIMLWINMKHKESTHKMRVESHHLLD